MVDIKIVFALMLKSLTPAVILAPYHPSGTLIPSQPDKALTRKIKRAGELLDIKTPESPYPYPFRKLLQFFR